MMDFMLASEGADTAEGLSGISSALKIRGYSFPVITKESLPVIPGIHRRTYMLMLQSLTVPMGLRSWIPQNS